MNKIKIIWVLTSNLGEEYDDYERFVGNNTKQTLQEEIVEHKDVAKKLESIADIPADYGDGVTNAKLLAIIDLETKEILPTEFSYWGGQKWENTL